MPHPLTPLAVRLLATVGAKSPRVNRTSHGSYMCRVSIYLGQSEREADERLRQVAAVLRRYFGHPHAAAGRTDHKEAIES